MSLVMMMSQFIMMMLLGWISFVFVCVSRIFLVSVSVIRVLSSLLCFGCLRMS